MESIFDTLFYGNYDPTPPLSKTQRQLMARLVPLYDQVQETFGRKFVDQLSGLQVEIDQLSSRIYFEEGFRLGAQLMLELFMPA